MDDTAIELGSLTPQYQDLEEAFNKQHATRLPLHRLYDCSTELPPGVNPTRERLFPLSQPETEVMQAYIKEELQKGFI